MLPVDWILVALLGLAALLVVLAAVAYYVPRPTYNAEQIETARGVAHAEILKQGRHHQEEQYGTVRLNPPRMHPRDM